MPIVLKTTLLLAGSNLFMTFAWYGHLRNLGDKPWYIAAIVRGFAFSAPFISSFAEGEISWAIVCS
jgi:uncharacterized protein (DUF486 family)